MEILAVAVLGFFAVGYFVLGGADIGTGMILPLLGRDTRERRLVVAAIAPFFLGNEVWLVAIIGILAGAFPALEATLMHDLFPAFVTLAAGWTVRDMGLWLRGRVDSRVWRALCDTSIVAGSWAVALSWGTVFASVLAGATDRAVIGPAAILGTLAVAALFAAHGLAFAALRLSGPLRKRARRLSGPIREAPLLAMTSAALMVLCLGAGARLSPAEATADPATLAFLLPPLLVTTPLLVAAQTWVWWIFRHRVTQPTYL
ncbi:cytochrome d ubiquinol oxidase subunit II [Streptosporangium subroseum]|uniref:cytochrome d ubiquinol oxidase subunit II n=1 Tax=Streptosporangium subroseum TaxID=106412 RepID=UPI003086EC0D|nr:cytochrome d ubiquinol oxidase subunit II [Streptosporangium subroseum]